MSVCVTLFVVISNYLPSFWLLEAIQSKPEHFNCPSLFHCEHIVLSFQHSVQISNVLYFGTTKDLCLDRIRRLDQSDTSGVFCAGDHFCGLDLQPEYSKPLKFSKSLNCSVYSGNSETWNKLKGSFRFSGKVNHC